MELICSAFVAALALVLPILVRHITGTLLEVGSENVMGDIIRVGFAMLAIIIVQTGFAVFADYKGHDVGAKIERDLLGNCLSIIKSCRLVSMTTKKLES